MNQIKLGMIFDSPSNYKGGINYFRNFAFALKQVNKDISLLLFISDDFDDHSLKDFGDNFKIIKSSIFRRYSILWFLDKLMFKIFKSSVIKHAVLKKFKIEIVFTFSELQKTNFFKIIFWLPDLQFLHFPEFFSASQRQSNLMMIKYMYNQSDRVILSSNSAYEDLKNLINKRLRNVAILNFVSQQKFDLDKDIKNLNYLQKKYNFKKSYFFLPNQFWKHKNHITVFEAMRIVNTEDFILICSGETSDHRFKNDNYMRSLRDFIISKKLNKRIKILGLIPYTDVISLMKHSVAVINPSLFEGWSSSVEEAKSMNKEIILSNIKVHLEQNPEFGNFFNPNDTKELSKILLNTFKKEKINKSYYSLEKETRVFGNKISKILTDITSEK